MASGDVHEKYVNMGWAIIIPTGGLMFMIFDWNILYPSFLYLNYWLTDFIDPDLDHSMMTRGEHDAKRKSKKFYLGFLGALFVAWSQIYEYFASMFGGHRSWFSHGIGIGTMTRILWFNSPLAWMMLSLVQHSILVWGHPPWEEIGFRYYYMNVWLIPYLVTQFVSWFIGDGIHLILDSKWAKGRLYGFEKFGDKRNRWQKLLTSRMKDISK